MSSFTIELHWYDSDSGVVCHGSVRQDHCWLSIWSPGHLGHCHGDEQQEKSTTQWMRHRSTFMKYFQIVTMKQSSMVVYEHSAAISNIHIDNTELITDDYDGVIILRYTIINTVHTMNCKAIFNISNVLKIWIWSLFFRNLRTYKRFNKMFKRQTMMDWKKIFESENAD